MALSPGSAERRAHLIREMSRPNDRGHASASNTASDASASGHIRAYAEDTDSRELAPLRPDQDFQINTSALRRAFPDFSQQGSSEEDSIEMGRGVKRNAKSAASRSMPSEDVTEDIPFTFGNGARYRITGTPPIKPRNPNIATIPAQAEGFKSNANAKYASNEKENVTGGKETRHGSGSSGENNDEGNKAADLHARVESDDSGSIVHGRASYLDASKRNSRFANRKAKQATSNEQSFILPDMPNITELISGVRQDGTPLFTRSSAKPRSRFATPHQGRRSKHSYAVAQNVPVPADEKALYVSLQLLQEKVAALEARNGQLEKKADDYELEVLQLKSNLAEKENARNSDSGIGTEPEAVQYKASRTEKSNLELSIKTLQDRLERTKRKVAESEVTIQNLTKDRDAAHQQLANAFVNSEELKNESQTMRDELNKIRNQVARLNQEHERKINELSELERELRGKIERREKAINEMSALAKELWQTRSALAATSTNSKAVPSYESQPPEQLHLKRARRETNGVDQFSTKPSASTANDATELRNASKATVTTRDTSRRHRLTNSQPSFYDVEHDKATNVESASNIYPSRSFTAEDLTRNSTYISFMEGDEVSKLRRVVEDDKAKLAIARGGTSGHHAASGLPRKPSLKRVQYEDGATQIQRQYSRSAVGGQSRDDVTNTIRSAEGTEREQTRQSAEYNIRDGHIRNGPIEKTEMTSAFILPDITLTGDALNAQLRPGHTEEEKKTMSIPRPVPVSDRMPFATEDEPDATIRPARPPGLALATVLKSLEDELEQLRKQLAEQEGLYHKHDPALSQRKRRIVYARIQKLLAATEIRADQIYALYDVLEGQKATGQTMEEEEAEVTLQNIGIDPQVLRRAMVPSKREGSEFQAHDDGAGDEETNSSVAEDEASEELPWEGFEPTQTQTLDNIGRLRAR